MASAEQGESFYLTTPIFYVNDVPHIGHAYTTTRRRHPDPLAPAARRDAPGS